MTISREYAGDSDHRSRLTPAVVVVLLNLAFWHVGIFFDMFGGWIDHVAAQLCIWTYGIAWFLVPAALLYSAYRRFASPRARWDLYGPALAILSIIVMRRESELTVRAG